MPGRTAAAAASSDLRTIFPMARSFSNSFCERMDMSALADVAQVTRAAAVAHVLDLEKNAVGIGEIQFRSSFFRASAVLHAHADIRRQRAGGAARVASRFDAEICQDLHDLVGIEAFHAEGSVID